MVSLENILKVDFAYPGLEIYVELIVLSEYLSQMDAGIKSICDGYIKKEMEIYEGCEHEEYQHVHVHSISEDEMPRIIRMPFIVTIYTLFENSVSRLLAYGQIKENKVLSLKDINGKSLTSTFNKYMSHVLEYEYQFSNKVSEKINNLNKIRNCIAHTNGNLSSMSKEKINGLKEISKKMSGIEVSNRSIELSTEFLESSMEFVSETLRDLMKYMESRYGFKLGHRN